MMSGLYPTWVTAGGVSSGSGRQLGIIVVGIQSGDFGFGAQDGGEDPPGRVREAEGGVAVVSGHARGRGPPRRDTAYPQQSPARGQPGDQRDDRGEQRLDDQPDSQDGGEDRESGEDRLQDPKGDFSAPVTVAVGSTCAPGLPRSP